MKKVYLCVIVLAWVMTGCGNEEIEHVRVRGNAASQPRVEENTEVTTVSQEIVEEVTATTETAEEVVSPAKAIFNEYQDDLTRLRFYDAEESEVIMHNDYIELTDMIITERFYLEASYVESLSSGDTITIQDIPYTIDTMEKDDYGYFVQLSTDEEADFDHGKYVYEDIYRLAPTEDKQNYYVFFCSDDIIAEQVYEGPIYIAKDATINAYFGDEVRDGTMEEFFEQEYPYVSAMEFTVDDNGLVTWIQNQIAG